MPRCRVFCTLVAAIWVVYQHAHFSALSPSEFITGANSTLHMRTFVTKIINHHTNMNKIWVSGHFAHSYFVTGHFTPYFIGGHFASIHVLWWTFRSPNKLTSFPRRCPRVGKNGHILAKRERECNFVGCK